MKGSGRPESVPEAVVRAFPTAGRYAGCQALGHGHIHDTFTVNCDGNNGTERFVFQRINHEVFRDVPALMSNIARICGHQSSKAPDARHALQLMNTSDGCAYHVDQQGNYWRAYRYIENSRTVEHGATAAEVYEIGKTVGCFLRGLDDLPGEPLYQTIPGFHDTSARVNSLVKAAENDAYGRVAAVHAELDFALASKPIALTYHELISSGQLPIRITHNDTKLNNVLLDRQSGDGLCVIDLDTCMNGCLLHDFGDMVRCAVSASAEDDPDALQPIDIDNFSALLEGFVIGVDGFMTPAEWDGLATAGSLMTYELGIRFLTDYLQGDVYFKTHYPDHNLARCRAQFSLLKSMLALEDRFREIVMRFM